jgi:hypothetical protein
MRVLLLSLLVAACSAQDVTVRLCCPEGHAYKENPDYDYDAWDYNDPSTHPRTCQEHLNKEELAYGGPGVRLEGDTKFKCPPFTFEVGGNEEGDGLIEKIQLLPSGDLKVVTENYTDNFSQGEYCIHFTNSASEFVNQTSEDAIRPVFSVCQSELTEQELEDREKTQQFYPILIFISSFFLFVTLVVYCLLQENRSKLFGKLTIGFLLNIFLAFLATGIHYSLNIAVNRYYLQTPLCKTLGYIVQHTWISFFCWMSAMALNITYTFTQSFRHSNAMSNKQTKAVVLHILVGQGVPLLITLVTLVMDTQGSSDKHVLPNMGEFSCFLGEEFKLEPGSFFKSPTFLYFYLPIVIAWVINIVCFIVTAVHLMSHWAKAKAMKQSRANNTPMAHAKILGSLLVIMGGPWIFEIISVYLEHARHTAFNARLGLDIINLLQGVLIFLAMVCKTQVMRPLRNTIASGFSTAGPMSKTSVTSMASRTSIVSEAPMRIPKSNMSMQNLS